MKVAARAVVAVLTTVCGSQWAMAKDENQRPTLSLEAFLSRAMAEDPAFGAFEARAKGTELESRQAELLTSPRAFVEHTQAEDRSPTLVPEFNGTSRSIAQSRAGAETQTSVGPKVRAFAFQETQGVRGVSSLPNPDLSIRRQGVGGEIEMSLWRNGFGRGIRLQRRAVELAGQGHRRLAEFGAVERSAKLKGVYARLAAASEEIEIYRELVKQGERLVGWALRQEEARLIEAAHLQQARSALELRRLGLEDAEIRRRSLSIEAASAIAGVTAFSTESLDAVESKVLAPLGLAQRRDVLAQERLADAEAVRMEIEVDSFSPDVALKGQYLSYGQSMNSGDSLRCRTPSDCMQASVGVVVSAPLDFETVAAGRAAAAHRASAARRELVRSKRDAEAQLAVLLEQVESADRQIASLRSLVKSQSRRLDEERGRQRRGRATTFDIIQAEQDLAESRRRYLGARAERVVAIAGLAAFGEEP